MKNIFDNYKKTFRSLSFAFLLVLSLILFSFLIVFPIWFFAENFPKQYTFVVSVLILLISGFILFRLSLNKLKKGKIQYLKQVAKIAFFIFFFAISIYALFNWNRILSLLFFLAPFIILLLVENFILKKSTL